MGDSLFLQSNSKMRKYQSKEWPVFNFQLKLFILRKTMLRVKREESGHFVQSLISRR